ncbi:MAG: PAS domain S-box protein [Syntrophobacteraceae bacterium]|nr:PAS domain S-box protein [Syntrophobacteraceae bacterium]
MDENYKDRILREQVRLAMQQLPTTLISTLIAAFALAWTAFGTIATWKIPVWISMFLATTLARTALYLQFRKVRDNAFNGKHWRNHYLIFNFIAGSVWGASALLILPPLNHPGLIFLFLLVIACVVATTPVSHSPLKLGPAALSAPVVMAYVVQCWMEGGELGHTIAMLGVLFLLAIIIYGQKHNRFVTSVILLRFENLELLEEVRRANDSICLEIAERKLAQKTVEESEEKFRLAFRTSPDSINLNRLSDGMVIDINEGFTKITGYTREEIIGKTPLQLKIWHNPKERDRIKARVAGKGFVENVEAEFRAKDGRLLTGLVSARILRLNQEDMVLSIIRDITAWKKTEEEKKKLQKELFLAQKMESIGRLAGGVAHDFNNMLSVIIGRAEMALHCSASDYLARQNLEEIIRTGQRSSALTRQLLTFASKQPTTPKITDLNETIPGMLSMLRRMIGEDIELSWKPGTDLGKVRIDHSQIDQILVNLVVNARDAICGAGSITVMTDNLAVDDAARAQKPELTPGSYVLLSVKDTGAGISREVCGQIFEPFFTTKELGKGTGLGLSTVYGIVKQNDGFIDVVSQPGKGATFTVYLPESENGTVAATESMATGDSLTGAETILLVEDNESILDIGKSMLEALGYTVLASQAPALAINLANIYPGDIDLLITDVIMPGMNGRELVEKLGLIRPGLKSLYMSGYTANVMSNRGILDETVNFIQKPFRKDDFAWKVRQVLDQPGE